LRSERCQYGGIDASREQNADRHIRKQVRPHGIAQPGAELLDELRLVVSSHLLQRDRAGPDVAFDLDAALRPDEQVARGELPRVAKDRVRRRDRIEREERLERVEIDLAARERAQLGRELELAARVAVVERFDPVAIACEHETPCLRVPDCNCEHAAESTHVLRAVALVEMEMDFGVAMRSERVALTLELTPQLRIVVDLAVLDDDARSVLARDRLVAARKVDDREAPCRQRDRTVDVLAGAVRPAVYERGAHRGQALNACRAGSRRDPTDPAHGSSLWSAAQRLPEHAQAVVTTVRR